MKTIKAYTYLLLGIALSLMCACSEEIFSPTTVKGEDVNLTLSYSDVSPREITVNTRATDAEERHLNNLYIYIFDDKGNLKGFKEITDENELDQETSSSHKASITGIKTKAGSSYIYAVANVSRDGLYQITTSSGKVEDGKLPVDLDEDKAQAGEYTFTRNSLKALSFTRSNDKSIQISSRFLMSGAVANGNIVNINNNGTIDGNDDAIRLSRIVSKVKFTIKAKEETGVTRSFKLSTYDIMNIAKNASLVGTIDGNKRTELKDANSFSNITGLVRGVNDVDETGAEFFEAYLPENLQTAKLSVSSQHKREDDSQTIPKAFTNAPEYGTYVVLKGRYEEKKDNFTRSADVKYYIHLGNCTENFNDYNVERNCQYTFNITVAGVDKIIVEAQKDSNEQPDAEGVVLEYSSGKNMILDSHYEYMVMRFYQSDIQELKKNGHGYCYQVYELGKHTDVINVTANASTGNKNGVSTGWIQFAIKNNGTISKYDPSATERGTACSYPGIQNIDLKTDGTGLYSIENFLKLLYDKADDANFWTGGTNGNKYIDATCFVDENYYQKLTWDQYVNDVDLRKFYVANTVETSKDGRSVYAKAQYGLSQYNIQTFYDRSQSDKVIAYGCETINDETGKGHTVSTDPSSGTDTWNGRENFLKEYQKKGTKWSDFTDNKDLRYDCLSRNRDLDGDGEIDPKTEVRWYAPTSAQYAGLWIGEDIISTEARLFNKSTSYFKQFGFGKEPEEATNYRMLYYTNTEGEEVFWSEEGMATSKSADDRPHYVRCVRNLKYKEVGSNKTPDKYFTWDEKNRLITLDKVDGGALNITGATGELNEHTERDKGNKPASKFYVAKKNVKKTSPLLGIHTGPTQKEVVEGTYTCAKNYSQDGKTWRVPNQREFSLMFIVAGNSSFSGLTKDDLNSAYVRTMFSGADFRKSWTCNGKTLNMASTFWNRNGYVRCISPTK